MHALAPWACTQEGVVPARALRACDGVAAPRRWLALVALAAVILTGKKARAHARRSSARPPAAAQAAGELAVGARRGGFGCRSGRSRRPAGVCLLQAPLRQQAHVAVLRYLIQVQLLKLFGRVVDDAAAAGARCGEGGVPGVRGRCTAGNMPGEPQQQSATSRTSAWPSA